MKREIQITPQGGIIRVTYRGDVQYDATTEMLREVAAIAARTGSKLLLIDVREANYRDYHVGTIRHAEEGPALGIDKTFRIAFLGARGYPMLEYVEAVSVNRGYWLKAFVDESEALAWLRDVM
jgi:hypothetical protein